MARTILLKFKRKLMGQTAALRKETKEKKKGKKKKKL